MMRLKKYLGCFSCTTVRAQPLQVALKNFMKAAINGVYGTCHMQLDRLIKKQIEVLIGFQNNKWLRPTISLGVPEENTPPQPPRKPLEDVITFID